MFQVVTPELILLLQGHHLVALDVLLVFLGLLPCSFHLQYEFSTYLRGVDV